jgi:hypothetical protein
LNNKLATVKYVINIPYYKNNSLETHRINKALAAGCQVISIYSSDIYLNEKYKDYVHFVNDLSDFCPLLEIFPKKDYNEFLKSYAEPQILQNINAIQMIEKIEKSKNEKGQNEKSETIEIKSEFVPQVIDFNQSNVIVLK